MKNKIIKLNNGLTLIMLKDNRFKSVYFDLAVKVGSRFENINNNGISHLIEHLFFNSSLNNLYQHKWIKHYIIDSYLAYTSKERTNYEFSLYYQDIDQGLGLLSDLILAKIDLNENKIEKEKKVVLEELAEKKLDMDFFYNKKIKELYYQNNSLSFEILGEATCLKKINKKDIQEFIEKYYIPQNMVLSIAGNFDETKIISQLNKIKTKTKNILLKNDLGFKNPENKLHFIKKNNEQIYFCLRCPALNKKADENVKFEFVSDLINHYLFFNMQKIIPFYSLNIGSDVYSDFFDFYIESYFNSKNASLFFKSLLKLLKNFKNDLNEKDFELFKKNKIINLELDQDYPKENTSLIAWYVLNFGDKKTFSIDEQIKIINSIKFIDLENLFNKVFSQNKINVFFIGNLSSEDKKIISAYWKNFKN